MYCGIIRKKEYEEAIGKIKNSNKEYYINLISKKDSDFYVLKVVNINKEKITAAIHKKSQDIYIVTEGRAILTYKGELIKPYKDDLERDYETIRGEGIKDGESIEISKGDIISIPPNTPHSVDAKNSEITFITVKIDNVI